MYMAMQRWQSFQNANTLNFLIDFGSMQVSLIYLLYAFRIILEEPNSNLDKNV